MSPPDGNLVAWRTVVDPVLKRRFAAEKIRSIADKERDVHDLFGRRYVPRASVLLVIADSLVEPGDHVASCLTILRTDRRVREARADVYPGDVGAFHAAMLPILDEAIGVVEALR